MNATQTSPAKKICAIEGCEKPLHGRGLCNTHYVGWRRSEGKHRERAINPEACAIDGCEKPAKTRSWCVAHYTRYQRHGHPLASAKPKPERLCTMDSCGRKHYAKDLCQMHWQRAWKHGNPDSVLQIQGDDEARFWSKIEKTDSCWNWVGTVLDNGYSQFRIGTGHTSGHRYSYSKLVGPIPDGLQIDHKCHNKACVNPAHLRAVTAKQNIENHNGACRSSKSGVRGVFWNKNSKKYRAVVVHNGVQHDLGQFDNPDDAGKAVIAKRNELHTHNDLDRI